ncbi:hypothetical protein NIES4072_22020 [Nostoc commune NIES-4072]|uniref:Uncharacterized protein n=1 Tax=Nostoc commune NIES-4072 TaxID=2005467 RepID=A0A2R5FIJ0_NOSCO|nr:hypothetical protein NIES4070_04780 [Nostoc commune HK-02]GBG18537.1 hypothetical protein NIES4072_22020 [Nostoc commune NIES-4072]
MNIFNSIFDSGTLLRYALKSDPIYVKMTLPLHSCKNNLCCDYPTRKPTNNLRKEELYACDFSTSHFGHELFQN